MHPAVVRRLVMRERQQAMREKIRRYAAEPDRATIERWQLEHFNAVWARCVREVPFYREWAREHALPDRIDRVSDLLAFPVLEKETIRDRHELVFQGDGITGAVSTGGSTGVPVRFPVRAPSLADWWGNMFAGRSWHGVAPFDPHVALWGHSHLFGSGLRGQVAHAKRRAADYVTNTTRLNAYDLTDEGLRQHAEQIRAANPVFVLGYTSAVFRLAGWIEREGFDLGSRRRLRTVILTSETVSDADLETVGRVFGAPVAIEYGAAETGVVAYSRRDPRPLQLFWDSYVGLVRDDGELLLTTISDQVFPLINYRLGDRVQARDVEDGNALTFDTILGRSQDTVRLPVASGTLELSAIMPVHILKQYPGVQAIQFAHSGGGLDIYLQADRPLDPEGLASYFTREVQRDHPQFQGHGVRFVQIDAPQLTVAGKHRLFREV